MKTNNPITNYWHAYYCADHCTLCGNTGWLDTRGVATPAGKVVGRVNYCICPNGQQRRAQLAEFTEDQIGASASGGGKTADSGKTIMIRLEFPAIGGGGS